MLIEHISEHASLLAKITGFSKRFSSNAPPSNFELLSFLKTWLMEHIVDSDKAYGKYIQDKLSQQTIKKY